MSDSSAGSVAIGTWVKVVEHDSGDEEVFQIVARDDASHLENKIPLDNPMGRVLLGSKPGEEVTLEGRNGPVRFSVLEIGG